MDSYDLTSAIITLSVIMAYINYRFINLQSTIAIMTGSLMLSLLLIILQHTGVSNISSLTTHWMLSINFRDLLLKGMLSYLLFAGALTIDLDTLKSLKWEIGILASISTIISAFIIGYLMFYMLPLFGIHLPFLLCLLFGALISPTDPIAVLATFKEIGASKKLTACVAGESLYNDGVGIVIFITISQLAFSGQAISFQNVALLFLQQAIGGVAYGALLGYLINRLIRHIDDTQMIILITLAIVTGAYSLALAMDISGPLAMVTSGILIGHHLRKYKSHQTFTKIYFFWEIIDEILNAVLFLLIGFELLTISTSLSLLWAGLMTIPLVLLVRLITVAIPMKFLQLKRIHEPHTISILTWGGLRGGLAVALALSLPESINRDIILTITFIVVTFAVIIQGTTIKTLTSKSTNQALKQDNRSK